MGHNISQPCECSHSMDEAELATTEAELDVVTCGSMPVLGRDSTEGLLKIDQVLPECAQEGSGILREQKKHGSLLRYPIDTCEFVTCDSVPVLRNDSKKSLLRMDKVLPDCAQEGSGKHDLEVHNIVLVDLDSTQCSEVDPSISSGRDSLEEDSEDARLLANDSLVHPTVICDAYHHEDQTTETFSSMVRVFTGVIVDADVGQGSGSTPIRELGDTSLQMSTANIQDEDANCSLRTIGNVESSLEHMECELRSKEETLAEVIVGMSTSSDLVPEIDSKSVTTVSMLEGDVPTVPKNNLMKMQNDESLELLECTSEKEDPVPGIVSKNPSEALPDAQKNVSLEDLAESTPINCNDESTMRANVGDEYSVLEKETVFEVGDIVILDQGVPREYCHRAAIVTDKADYHCTVVVLDESRRYGIGECWPNYEMIVLDSSRLRLGTRVVVSGMQNVRTKHLNGHIGVISKHPCQGHPNFIKKAKQPDAPQLTVCVAFGDLFVKERSVLLEPRFLTAWEDMSLEMMWSLTEAATRLLEAEKNGKLEIAKGLEVDVSQKETSAN